MMKTGRNFMIGAAVMAVSVLTPLTSFAASCGNIVPGCNYGSANNTGIISVIGGSQANCPGGAGSSCNGKDCKTNGKNCSGKDNCGKPGCTTIKNFASLLGQESSCRK